MWKAWPHSRLRNLSPSTQSLQRERSRRFQPSRVSTLRKKSCTTSTAASCNTFSARCSSGKGGARGSHCRLSAWRWRENSFSFCKSSFRVARHSSGDTTLDCRDLVGVLISSSPFRLRTSNQERRCILGEGCSLRRCPSRMARGLVALLAQSSTLVDDDACSRTGKCPLGSRLGWLSARSKKSPRMILD